jgi:hypothetical protein
MQPITEEPFGEGSSFSPVFVYSLGPFKLYVHTITSEVISAVDTNPGETQCETKRRLPEWPSSV